MFVVFNIMSDNKVKDKLVIRRIYSLPITDVEMETHIENRASRHKGGRAGYLRELVELDLIKYKNTESIRQAALSKLSDEERNALGF
jgi:hypothetical protein